MDVRFLDHFVAHPASPKGPQPGAQLYGRMSLRELGGHRAIFFGAIKLRGEVRIFTVGQLGRVARGGSMAGQTPGR